VARIPQAMVMPEMMGSTLGGAPPEFSGALPDLGQEEEAAKSDALRKALIALGVIPEEQALLMRQANQGQSMMDAPTPQGMRVGGTYVASSPLEHIAAVVQRAVGANKQKTAEEGYRESLAKQTAGRDASYQAQDQLASTQNAQIQALIDAITKGGF